jgi:tetratricopeptide (TPR) repeat protein
VVPHFTLWLAEAYGKTERFDEAFSTLEEALSLVDDGKELFNESELHRIRGELLLAHSDGIDPAVTNTIEACFNRAREIARHHRSRSLELRAATSLGRLRDRQDRRQEARAILTPIYEWFTEGLDTTDLRDTRALMDALNGCRP